jgi:hypothetical protein
MGVKIYTDYSDRSHVLAGEKPPEDVREFLKKEKLANYHPRLYPTGIEFQKGWLVRKEKLEEVEKLLTEKKIEFSKEPAVSRPKKCKPDYGSPIPRWEKTNRKLFEGLEFSKLVPLMELVRIKNSCKYITLPGNSLPFKKSTLVALVKDQEISAVGLVISGLMRTTKILILESADSGFVVGTCAEIKNTSNLYKPPAEYLASIPESEIQRLQKAIRISK